MKEFLAQDYLLDNEIAKSLYEQNKNLPIFDYHCHLEAKDIFLNKKFDNLTQLWICDEEGKGDHYKWRLLRASGIEEKYITGDASDYDKFFALAKIMPSLIGNPIYEWCHLELRKYFDINLQINEANAKEIYDITKEKLKNLSCQDFIKMSNVSTLFTTDDLLSDLCYHDRINGQELGFLVYPSFRVDNVLNIENSSFIPYIKDLERIAFQQIKSLKDLKEVVVKRIKYFKKHGCLTADIGINKYFPYIDLKEDEVNEIFIKALKKQSLSINEIDAFKTNIIGFLLKEFSMNNLVCELHIGPLRNVSEINLYKHGKDTGFDMMNNFSYIENLSKLLSKIEKEISLPKLIIFPLNENDYDAILTLIASFINKKGHIQLGAAWWFNDNYDGIINNLKKQASQIPIANFVGMLTDSRSFTSYIRHDYFRRIVCSFISSFVINGRYPNNMDILNKIVRNIFFENAKNFFLEG